MLKKRNVSPQIATPVSRYKVWNRYIDYNFNPGLMLEYLMSMTRMSFGSSIFLVSLLLCSLFKLEGPVENSQVGRECQDLLQCIAPTGLHLLEDFCVGREHCIIILLNFVNNHNSSILF